MRGAASFLLTQTLSFQGFHPSVGLVRHSDLYREHGRHSHGRGGGSSEGSVVGIVDIVSVVIVLVNEVVRKR